MVAEDYVAIGAHDDGFDVQLYNAAEDIGELYEWFAAHDEALEYARGIARAENVRIRDGEEWI